jgi:hypothetical protein
MNMYFESWRSLFYAYSIGFASLLVVSFFVLYEDPVFCFDTGKFEKCKEMIIEMGEENNESE